MYEFVNKHATQCHGILVHISRYEPLLGHVKALICITKWHWKSILQHINPYVDILRHILQRDSNPQPLSS